MKCIQRSSSNVSFALNAAALAPYDPQLPFGLNAVRLDWIGMSHTLLSEHCAVNSSTDTLKTFAGWLQHKWRFAPGVQHAYALKYSVTPVFTSGGATFGRSGFTF